MVSDTTVPRVAKTLDKAVEAFQMSWSDVGANIVPALLIRGFNFSD